VYLVESAESVFINCGFELNYAGKIGGGIAAQLSSASFKNCSWRNNTAGGSENYGRGGGISWQSLSISETLMFMECIFKFNTAGYNGGGIDLQDAAFNFSRCIWRHNTASGSAASGGGLHVSFPKRRGVARLKYLPVISNCTFTENHAANKGGGAYISSCPGLQFKATTFLRNTAHSGSGGALLVYVRATIAEEVMLSFHSCMFVENSAFAGTGGALSLKIDPPAHETADSANLPSVCVLQDTVLAKNTAGGRGGAISVYFPPDTPANLHFVDGCPGIVCASPTDSTVNTPPSVFVQHTARLWNRSVLLRLANNLFEANVAGDSGGALAMTNGAAQLANVTLSANIAALYGGAVYFDGTAAVNATQTSWLKNTLLESGSADGQHIYAAAGAGEWHFGNSTIVEHANTSAAGFSGAQTDGVYGLTPEVVTVVCPAGAVKTDPAQWVGNFTSVSGEWALRGGQTIINTTHVVFDSSDGFFTVLPSNVTTSGNTRCESQYFAHPMCGNPPPIYPPMVFTAVKLGCQQCSRSEAALPTRKNEAALSAQQSSCEQCPEHWGNAAKCDFGHVNQQAGWWRAKEDELVKSDTIFWACYSHEKACLGTATLDPPAIDTQCARGHVGPVCAICTPGFVMVHSVCQQCVGSAWAAIGSVAAIAVSVFGSAAALFIYREKLGIRRLSAIKIIIGYYSLLAVVEQTFAIAWPEGFQQVLSRVKAAFTSVLDLSSFGCAVSVDWFQKVGFWCLALLVAFLAIATAFARALREARAADQTMLARDAAVPPARHGQLSRLMDRLFGAHRPPGFDVQYSAYVFNMMLLLYPFLSPAAVAVFNCREVAGSWYVEADYSLHCFDSRWNWWAAISTFVCVFYIAGFPCLVLYCVLSRSPSIEFISNGYRTDGGRVCLGWEVVEMVRKFLLTSAVIFWPKGSCVQVTVAVLVSTFFLVFHVYHMPFDSPTDNWFQVFALVGLLLVYFMGLLIKVQPDLESRYSFDSVLQIVSMAVGIIVVGVPIIHKSRLKWRQWGHAKQPLASDVMVELSEQLITDEDCGGDGEYIRKLRAELGVMHERDQVRQAKIAELTDLLAASSQWAGE
jgi:hypothetical protein